MKVAIAQVKPNMSSSEFIAGRETATDTVAEKKLNVLFVDVRDSIGGDSTVLLSILRYLNQDRFAPVVACHHKGALYNEIKSIPGLTVIPLNFGTRDSQAARMGLTGKLVAAVSFARTFVCALRLIALIKRRRINVIHSNNTVRAVLITNFISRLTGVGYIYHAHSALQDHPVQIKGAREADCLLANSEYTATTYAPAGVLPERFAVIYNGIDTEEFTPEYKSTKLRSELNIDKNAALVGLIGRLTPSKGQEELIKAAPAVVAAVPNVRFLLVGDDSIFDNNQGYADRLKAMIHERGLDEKFIFTGFRRDLRDIYAALNVVLMPSNSPEGLGMVAIEGMAMGRPVITSDAGALPEVTKDGAGVSVPAGDYVALGEALIRVLADSTIAEKLAVQGRKKVEQHFSMKQFSPAFERLLVRVSSK